MILSRDGSPLTISRAPENRFFGCCRHYALLAASIFRTHGVPARVRAGFATYFTSGFFEDHWVCEYWYNGQWRLLDAELDEFAVKDFSIAFQPWDVPRDRFIDASTTWHYLRNGKIDPTRVGLSTIGIAGMWFAAGSVLRDVAALNKEEMHPWDTWSVGRELADGQDVPGHIAERLDTVADALRGAPSGDLAQRVYLENEWLRVTPTILSFPKGVPTEVLLSAVP